MTVQCTEHLNHANHCSYNYELDDPEWWQDWGLDRCDHMIEIVPSTDFADRFEPREE